ncbi:MAG: glycine cleavage system protein GcvH [Thiohalophilus sp.]|uniref:glycine cleavage system protein GcvH n=1 Tax=Thiohalophilus sp. TaxID=3028392 RepID=UPI0028702E82|nr:glycine cleavage system protein GcvH [Thiohalophilus sp.]MDR9435882.1 glycine cleavage system protein GcvH [Thiohalophilus sp.]
MSNIPQELRFTKSHEWVKREEDGTLVVGITDHAQQLLGDLVFVEVPEVGSSFKDSDDCAVIESVKAASDVYCPIAGEVLESNEALADAPETINNDPYGDGWIFKLKPEDEGAYDALMDADAYAEVVAEDEH